ncbi:hypothetical protein EON67_01720 [archaeon]|nr:MAG: hypothetical protein EON67_01720 [archaeon]
MCGTRRGNGRRTRVVRRARRARPAREYIRCRGPCIAHPRARARARVHNAATRRDSASRPPDADALGCASCAALRMHETVRGCVRSRVCRQRAFAKLLCLFIPIMSAPGDSGAGTEGSGDAFAGRRVLYKKTVDEAESRRKREEHAVAIGKKKREEQLSKRRMVRVFCAGSTPLHAHLLCTRTSPRAHVRACACACMCAGVGGGGG